MVLIVCCMALQQTQTSHDATGEEPWSRGGQKSSLACSNRARDLANKYCRTLPRGCTDITSNIPDLAHRGPDQQSDETLKDEVPGGSSESNPVHLAIW